MVTRNYLSTRPVGMTTGADVAGIARWICANFAAGYRGLLRYGRVVFDLTDVAMCARFVRECYEAALQTAEYTWAWRGASAREVEWKLRRAGKAVAREDMRPGDIVAFNWGTDCVWGHIGVALGNNEVALNRKTYAENTSSTRRGPGFVISTFAEIGYHRLSGVYRVLPTERELKIVLLPESEIIACNPRVEKGVTRVDARALANALGYTTYDHIGDQLKVYMRRRP